MGYYTYTKNPVGVFVEKEAGNSFEYSLNDDPYNGLNEDFPHKVWVGGGQINDSGYRYANVKKTVAYVCVDEDDHGMPIIEKWYIKNHREYTI